MCLDKFIGDIKKICQCSDTLHRSYLLLPDKTIIAIYVNNQKRTKRKV